jgi:Domain of unknown function (DUF4383)
MSIAATSQLSVPQLAAAWSFQSRSVVARGTQTLYSRGREVKVAGVDPPAHWAVSVSGGVDMSARGISVVLGLILIVIGALGFFPQYQHFVGPGDDFPFKFDLYHNGLFLAGGVLMLLLPAIVGGKPTLLLMGVIFAAIAVLGMMHAGDPFLINGQVAMNDYDRYLHIAVAAVLLLAGLVFSDELADDV